MSDQRNLIIAIALSMAIMLGFNYFYDAPRQQEQILKAQQNSVLENSVSPLTNTVTPILLKREEAIAKSPRLFILSEKVQGSIDLRGARFDDLLLKSYKETTAPNSAPISLLNPEETQGSSVGDSIKTGYFADFSLKINDPTMPLPSRETLWASDDTQLTPEKPVILTWNNGQGLLFKRTISLDENYVFTIQDEVVSQLDRTVTLTPCARITRLDTPQVGGFMILHEGLIGVINGKLQEIGYEDLKEKPQNPQETTGGWLGITDKYWLVSLIPNQAEKVKTHFAASKLNGRDIYSVDVDGIAQSLAPESKLVFTQHLFAGAKKLHMLDAYESKLGIQKFDLAVDFGVLYFLTKPFFHMLDYLHKMLGNFGVAILIITILLKLAFFPLANKSFRSMSRMKKLQPKMEALKARYENDRVKMSQEMMELYRREKVNPASGCLPMLIQAPIFFCLYKVLFISLEMRHAPFFGWIQDLSAPDPTSFINLFGLLPFDAPSFLQIGLWPLFMGATMVLQQRLNPQPADPVQAKLFLIMPVMFTYMFASFPVGLVIYWAWSNVLTIVQQMTIMKLEEKRA